MLLLVNYRPEYRHEWGNRSHYTQLRLDPLVGESAEQLLSALLGEAAELAALRRLIAERTEGNPFFVEEMVRALFDDGTLARNGAVKLIRPLTEIKAPATVRGIVASRIDRLPADEKELLQTLAVIGREFPRSLVMRIVRKSSGELDRLLSNLRLADFIYEQPSVPETEYTFKHALTLEVAYGTLLLGRRKHLHECAAAAIEALYHPERLDDHLNDLAHHYSQSGNAWKAVKYRRLAGRQAAMRLAYDEAIGHFTAALELLASLPEDAARDRQELELRADLGPYLIATKGPAAEEVAAVFARARTLCEKLDEPRQLFWVAYALQFFHLLRLELRAARELGERQIELAERSQNPTMLMAAYSAMSEVLSNLGEFRAARELCTKGGALDYVPAPSAFSEIGEPRTMLLAHSSRDLFILGYPDQALALSREALAGARQLGPHSLAFALNLAAEIHRYLGDEGAAWELTEALAVLAGERGFLLWSAQAVFLRGEGLVTEGQFEQGIIELRRGAALVEMTGAVAGIWKLPLAQAYGKIGRPEQGLAAIAEALDLMRETGLRVFEAELYRVKGELILLETPGAVAEAEGALRQALACARRQEAKSWELRAATTLARLLGTQGRAGEARAMLGEIYGWFTEGFGSADLKSAKALLDDLGG